MHFKKTRCVRTQATTGKFKISENLKKEIEKLNFFSSSKRLKIMESLFVDQFVSHPGEIA